MKAIVLSVRGLNLAYLGCQGNEWITTPALDRLAATGITFDQHFADVPDPPAARRAWLTGRYQLPPLSAEGAQPAESADLLAELRRAGIRTELVADGTHTLPDEFLQGWDNATVVRDAGKEPTIFENTLETVRARLATLADTERWLLWVELAVLLPPWNIPSEFSDPYFEETRAQEEETEADDEEDEEAEEEAIEFEPILPNFDPQPGVIDGEDDDVFLGLQASYAGAVSYLDAGVGALVEELEHRGLKDHCLLILTGDHGQALGEHGIVGPCRPWLHEEVVHVPLLMQLPSEQTANREAGGGRVQSITLSVDLMPTLLEAFTVPVPETVQGRSLWPLLSPTADPLRDYACCGWRIGDAAEWCLRTPEWSFLLPADGERKRQLYVKPDDRWEVNDVVQHHFDEAERLEAILKEFVAATHRPGPLVTPPLQNETPV